MQVARSSFCVECHAAVAKSKLSEHWEVPCNFVKQCLLRCTEVIPIWMSTSAVSKYVGLERDEFKIVARQTPQHQKSAAAHIPAMNITAAISKPQATEPSKHHPDEVPLHRECPANYTCTCSPKVRTMVMRMASEDLCART